ncbi:MAG: 50S ribosome-binding GTPase [Planctomycetaceae bacterium]|nr:50S ribosome-binding GTPase [Planctomycetaceae bacterium]
MAPTDLEQTIAAIASAPGSSARGIIRISGADSVSVVAKCFQPSADQPSLPELRRPQRLDGHVTGADVGTPIPAAAMIWPTRRSYTGQPMVELHLVGSPPLLDAVLESLFAAGARGAGRGEFTLRAFLAGRMDLVQAEAVLGVIDAADHEELSTALTQLGGGITHQLASVRRDVIGLLGDLEAGLDFVEEDIEFITADQIHQRLTACRETVSALLGQSVARLPSGRRPRVVLAGLPNAGKSTLFNRLIGDTKAIVSPVAGTTRDYLTADVPIGGVDVQLVDTAGWETASDVVMQQAQQLRNEQTLGGDLIVWCESCVLTPELQQENEECLQALPEAHVLRVRTQVDRLPDKNHAAGGGADRPSLCAQDGRGLDGFAAAVAAFFQRESSERSELLASTTARCRESLNATIQAIDAAIAAVAGQFGDEIIAIELRAALEHLGIILGEVYTDDILDHIFSSFCIGK